MKILLVNYEYKPQCGGAGLGIYNQAKAFKQKGHEVTILIGWDYAYGEPEIIEGVVTEIIPIKKKNVQQSSPIGLAKFVICGLRRINVLTRKTKFDIVQFYFSVPTGVLKYGIHGNVPYVVSLRGMDIPGLNKDHEKLSLLTKGINRRITANAAAVTSLTHEAARVYNAFSPNIDISVIPNAVDSKLYSQKTLYSKRITKFLSIARLTGFKRLPLLIRSISKVHEDNPSITLDIYGEGPDRADLENLINELDAANYINLMGFCDREVLYKRMAEYDVFSLLSTGDSFGMVFVEAMSAGLPVLCARAGGPVNIVQEGKTGIFAEPDNFDSAVNAIKYCIQNPDVMEEMGRNGHLLVEKEYSIDGVANQHLELYNKCIAMNTTVQNNFQPTIPPSESR